MERTPAGEFLEEGKTYRIRYDSVSLVPRRAALIVDGRVASSGEQLVLKYGLRAVVRPSTDRTTRWGASTIRTARYFISLGTRRVG